MISVYLIKYTDLQQAKERILQEYSKKSKGKTYTIEYLPSGAPQLIANSKPSGCVSISHTDSWLAMAFSKDKIGIDLERADREVSSKVCESIEKWTRIEAYAKWTGLGLSRDMLFEKLPDDMIITKRFAKYVVSVCGTTKDFQIVALV
ncbi:MAG: hypothetical protein K2M75_03980 [Clostridia bacterium]|nr:hypothetical protein [Clostridia bacterium]